MNTFFNFQKNQQNNILPNIFNDFSNTKKNTTFLKKKSHGEIINNIEDDEEKENHKQEHNKSRKYSNYCYDFQNPLINDLDEEKEENMEEYENYFENNNHKKGRKDENISFKQILDDAIQEKKELDLKERDKKKANKLKQLKMEYYLLVLKMVNLLYTKKEIIQLKIILKKKKVLFIIIFSYRILI